MFIIADLHIHSHYSRATSKNLDFEHLYMWAKYKGVHVVGTGDFTHPGWCEEIRTKLEPAEQGLWRLKDEYVRQVEEQMLPLAHDTVRFLLTTEISSIYKKKGKVRKVHNLLFAPDLESVTKINTALDKIGNLKSDGRPILGLDAKDLLELVLGISNDIHLVPAHIWTPWFSLLGHKSGFDSLEECFEDLSRHIFAVETGLSSDPAMNWRCSQLDRLTLISNSDAHSPAKLAREANLFDCELSYQAMFEALQTGDSQRFKGTLEFYPQEGKYHFDGHRKCQTRLAPQETKAHQGLCPVCGKPVTIGVMHRVEDLADRPPGAKPAHTHPFESLVTLPQLLAQMHQQGENTKKVQQTYQAILRHLGSELTVLRDIPLEMIREHGSALLAEGIRRIRTGEVNIASGYDGEYGTIKIFQPQDYQQYTTQMTFFDLAVPETPQPKAQQTTEGTEKTARSAQVSPPPSQQNVNVGSPAFQQKVNTPETAATEQMDTLQPLPLQSALPDSQSNIGASSTSAAVASGGISTSAKTPSLSATVPPLNALQQQALRWQATPLLIIAGPGTGKTRTLTHRIAHLIQTRQVAPSQILAITFTHKAAQEMRERLATLGCGPDITISTFHAFGLQLIQENTGQNWKIYDEQDQLALLQTCCPQLSKTACQKLREQIAKAKARLATPQEVDSPLAEHYQCYQQALQTEQALDFADLLFLAVQQLRSDPQLLSQYRQRYPFILIDEYQDINQAQYELIKLLVDEHTELCAIGDPDQAIYGFRGADVGYFLNFQQDFARAQVIRFTRNYRSTQNILQAAYHVISGNPDPQRRPLHSERKGNPVLVYQAPTEKAEAEFVVHTIEQLIGGTTHFSLDSGRVATTAQADYSFASFAVLFRSSRQVPVLEEAVARSGMPYQVIGAPSLFSLPNIKPQILLLRWAAHPTGKQDFHQLLHQVPWQLPPSLRTTLQEQLQHQSVAQLLDQPLEDISKRQQQRWNQVRAFLKELSQRASEQSSLQVLEFVWGYLQFDRESDNAQQTQAARALANIANQYEQLSEFVNHVTLQSGPDSFDAQADKITLMTLHAAKGLEFQVVFMVGMEQGILPHYQSKTPAAQTEERRLCYVGMTRARDQLYLVYSRKRRLWGRPKECQPSPYLQDIPATLITTLSATSKTRRSCPQDPSLFDNL